PTHSVRTGADANRIAAVPVGRGPAHQFLALRPGAAHLLRDRTALLDERDGLTRGRLPVAAKRDPTPDQRALAQAKVEALLRLPPADGEPLPAGCGPPFVGDGDEVGLLRVDLQPVRAIGPGARQPAEVVVGVAAALDLQGDSRRGLAVGQQDL